MQIKNIRNNIGKTTLFLIGWIETALALFIVLAVIIDIKGLILLIYSLLRGTHIESYAMFTSFLEHVLLLVIGLELTETLLDHASGSLVDVMLYAIARKMLIRSANAYELLAGTAAIIGLFATKKYFLQKGK